MLNVISHSSMKYYENFQNKADYDWRRYSSNVSLCRRNIRETRSKARYKTTPSICPMRVKSEATVTLNVHIVFRLTRSTQLKWYCRIYLRCLHLFKKSFRFSKAFTRFIPNWKLVAFVHVNEIPSNFHKN